MIKEVYQALKKRIGEIAEMDRVDWFMNQYNEADESGNVLVYETPVVYLEFPPIEWQQMGSGIQRATISFNAHLVTESVADDDKRILDTTYVNHLGIENKVFVKLNNWRTNLSYVDAYGSLANTDKDRVLIESIVRKVTEPDHNLSEFVVTVQQFSCVIYDYSGMKNWKKVLAEISLEVNAQLSKDAKF